MNRSDGEGTPGRAAATDTGPATAAPLSLIKKANVATFTSAFPVAAAANYWHFERWSEPTANLFSTCCTASPLVQGEKECTTCCRGLLGQPLLVQRGQIEEVLGVQECFLVPILDDIGFVWGSILTMDGAGARKVRIHPSRDTDRF